MRFNNKSFLFLAGVGLGAVVMYFLDPKTGSGRRAVARDRLGKAGRRAGEMVEGQARELAHQAKDLAGKARHRLEEAIAGDDVLVKRVQTALGRVISNPRHITVTADKGEVTLTGTVAEDDSIALGPVVTGVRGVRNLVDRTLVEEEAIG